MTNDEVTGNRTDNGNANSFISYRTVGGFQVVQISWRGMLKPGKSAGETDS
jgi:hypothetical protein